MYFKKTSHLIDLVEKELSGGRVLFACRKAKNLQSRELTLSQIFSLIISECALFLLWATNVSHKRRGKMVFDVYIELLL